MSFCFIQPKFDYKSDDLFRFFIFRKDKKLNIKVIW